jgi:GDPmannose 4,6-dehydratase
MAKTALVTGISGQDGAYLAKALLDRGYRVVGAYRRTSGINVGRLVELGIADNVELIDLELLEESNLRRALERVKPDEIYNLAAQSFVGLSFEVPVYTAEIDALGVLRLLEAMRTVCSEARFYQASTSEMFGKVQETPQTERTPFYPRSPYGVAKLFAHWTVVNYREAHGLFATSGILFNHESPLRGQEFVTRKATLGLARVSLGQQDKLLVGNLDSKRDWGFAGDYVDGMWRMLQQDSPGDYVLATGRTTPVREFVERAAEALGFQIEWSGADENTRGIDKGSGRTIVAVDPRFFRPAEVDLLIGDASKARDELNWVPQITLEQLIDMMAKADYDRVKTGIMRC